MKKRPKSNAERRKRLRALTRQALAANTPDAKAVRIRVSFDPANPRDWAQWIFRLEIADGSRAPFDIEFAKVTDRGLVLTLLELLDREGRMAALKADVAQFELDRQSARSKGGGATAKGRKEAASARARARDKAAASIRKIEPNIKKAALAATLAERGHGTAKTLEKRLAGKKSRERR